VPDAPTFAPDLWHDDLLLLLFVFLSLSLEAIQQTDCHYPLPLCPIAAVQPPSIISSSNIPHLPPMNVNALHACGVVASAAASANSNSATAAAFIPTRTLASDAHFGDIALQSGDIFVNCVVEQKLVFLMKVMIREDRYFVLCTLLAAELERRNIHTIVHQKERVKAWANFYSEVIGDTGIMRRFMYYESSTPAPQIFRRMVNAGWIMMQVCIPHGDQMVRGIHLN
jgi:hypothetical protein